MVFPRLQDGSAFYLKHPRRPLAVGDCVLDTTWGNAISDACYGFDFPSQGLKQSVASQITHCQYKRIDFLNFELALRISIHAFRRMT